MRSFISPFALSDLRQQNKIVHQDIYLKNKKKTNLSNSNIESRSPDHQNGPRVALEDAEVKLGQTKKKRRAGGRKEATSDARWDEVFHLLSSERQMAFRITKISRL